VRIDPLAVTYARALVELAREAGRLEEVIEEMRFLGRLLAEDRDLRTFIESPGISVEDKRGVIERALRGKLDDLVLDFLGVLLGKKRQLLLREVFAACEVLYDEVMGRVRVEAVTAVPLDPGLRDELTALLGTKLGKTVILENVVRPEVIGGLVIRYGDRVADDSVQAAIERIGRRLEDTKIGSELVHENQPG
jgi:F-type H+-transporting ATPase subunit delta